MKKIVLATLFASSVISSAAMADVYMGVEYGAANSTETQKDYTGSTDYKNNYSDLKFKIGGGSEDGIKFQAYFSKIDYAEGEFIVEEANSLYEFGFDIIKEFEATSSIYPFLKVGMGAGVMDTEITVDGYAREVSFNIGAGVSYKVIDHIYILAGVDYVYRKWNDIVDNSGIYTLETSDSGVKPYIGVNYEF